MVTPVVVGQDEGGNPWAFSLLNVAMPKRVSHSLLDPFVTTPLKAIYPRLGLPAGFPPEGIVLAGHLLAIVGAVGCVSSRRTGDGSAI